ncbi:MAG: DsbA family protein [Candidatus Binatia bacterium]
METGKVKYVFIDFPLESIHSKAFKAHEAANCAGDQGKYWEMHDRIFTNQRTLEAKELSEHAGSIGLDLSTFEQCLNSGKHATEIRNDMAEGVKAGVRGTPTFLLGLTEPNGSSKVKATTIIRGAQPYTRFKQVIDSLLGPQKK